MKLIRQIYDERFKFLKRERKLIEKARKIQAKEYERRLEALNGEARRILESQQKSISVEKFDGIIGQLNTSMNSTNDKIAELSKRLYIIMGGLIVIEFLLKYIFKT